MQPSAELRSRYEAAVRQERTAWVALQNTSDADKSYSSVEALWHEAASRVAELAQQMPDAGRTGT